MNYNLNYNVVKKINVKKIIYKIIIKNGLKLQHMDLRKLKTTR